MTLKVVRGVVSQGTDPSSGTVKNSTTNVTNQAVQKSISGNLGQLSARTSEAVQTTLNAKGLSTSGADKIRDSKEADKVAKDVAERIREEEGSALESHAGLEGSSARHHFA